MDALPPPPAETAPAPPPPAATDIYPRDARERELCDRAGSPDWLYLTVPPLLFAGAIVLDTQVFKFDPQPGVRTIGPGLVGLTFGVMAGAIYPAMPKCSMHWAPTEPPEGVVRTSWPLAFAIAGLSMVLGPVFENIATGPVPLDWTTEERVTRLLLTGGLSFTGALLPYLLPPKTMRAARELRDLRVGASATGAFATYTFRF